MRDYPIDKTKIDKNQIWTVSYGISPVEFIIGDFNDFTFKYPLTKNETDDLLQYGWVDDSSNGHHYETFLFRIGDKVKDNNGYEYLIRDININNINGAFILNLWDINNYKNIEIPIGELEFDLQTGDYEIIETEEDLKDTELDEVFKGVEEKKDIVRPCSTLNPDCEIVTSYMPISGKSFKVCRTHKREVD